MPVYRPDLIVIGSGYWGTAIALEALHKGWSVRILDAYDPHSGSRNASAICDPKAYSSNTFKGYMPSDWTKEELRESFVWLVSNGGQLVQERFRNAFAGTGSREANSAIYLPTPETLTNKVRKETRQGEVVDGNPVGGEITVSHFPQYAPTDKSKLIQYSYQRLVVAAGYKTDEVLKALGLPLLGVNRLAGRGILATGTPLEALPVSVMLRPYCKHTVRTWGMYGKTDSTPLYKVGDTAEEVLKDSKLEALRTVGRSVLGDYEEIQVNLGYRPVLDKFTVVKLLPNLVVATGGHRLGLGLSGLVAKKVMRCFS